MIIYAIFIISIANVFLIFIIYERKQSALLQRTSVGKTVQKLTQQKNSLQKIKKKDPKALKTAKRGQKPKKRQKSAPKQVPESSITFQRSSEFARPTAQSIQQQLMELASGKHHDYKNAVDAAYLAHLGTRRFCLLSGWAC